MNSRHESSNLDFLRTVAVLLVVSRHVMGALQWSEDGWFKPELLGLLGVLMFFVHTSLVLMFSLERQRAKHGDRLLFSTFWIRRFFRIYPLSMAVVSTVFAATMIWNPASHILHVQNVHDFICNLLLVQNLTGSPNIISPLWSLPVELQMYVFLPFLFLCAHRIGFRGLLFGIWPLSFAIALTQLKYPVLIADVLLFAPCFLPGIICYALSSQRRVVAFWVMPFLLLLCLLAYMILGSYSPIMGGYPICLALGLSLPFIKETGNQTMKTFCHIVAKYSYSIYLLHGILLSIVFYFLSAAPLPARLVAFIAVTGIFCFLSYHLIESPMIAWGNKIASRQHPRRDAPTQIELSMEEPTPVP